MTWGRSGSDQRPMLGRRPTRFSTIDIMSPDRSYATDKVDVVMLGTFSTWRLGTLQARALPLAIALRRQGVRCAIVTVPWDRRVERGVVDVISGVQLVNTASTSIRETPRAVVEQIAAVRALRPSIIHIFKPKGFGALSGMVARMRPIVVDSDDWEGDGGWNRLGSYNILQRRVFAWQERRLIQMADCVTAASTLLVHRARSLRPQLDSTTTCYVPNGLAGDWLDSLRRAREARLSESEPAVLRVILYSRFAEFPTDWIQSFLSELDSVVVGLVEVCLVGERERIDNGRKRVIVTHMGYVARDDIPAVLASSSIAIYPYADSLVSRSKNSVKLLELMASGCAIVAADIGDVPTALGAAGVLVERGNPIDSARAVARLLSAPSARARIGQAAQQRVGQLFSVDAIASRLSDAYLIAGS